MSLSIMKFIKRRHFALFPKISWQLSTALFALLFCGLACGDEKSKAIEDGNPEVEKITVRVLVTNPEGEPVSGATVTPSGMRTRLERGSHYGWSEERHGKLPKTLTDEAGMVEVSCPKFVYEKLEIGEITWMVEHEDYIMFREDRSVDDDPAKITLKRGRRIAVTAIDAETKEPITEKLHAVLSGSGGRDEWATTNSGMLMSRGVNTQRNTLRVFTLPDKGPVKFSKSIDLNEHGKKSRVLLRGIELQPGTRVEGRIDEQVLRPIKNGVVVVHVITGLGNELYGSYESRNNWSDWTTINEDGTFVFESLPRGDVAQMITVCDGWVCSHPTAEDLKSVGLEAFESQISDSRVAPQVALLDGDVIKPVIKMEPTASCQVTVLDPDGEPLEGAMVHSNPNQIFFGGGSNIVGDGYSLRAALKAADQIKDMTWGRGARDKYVELGIMSPFSQRYIVTTNEAGTAELHTLPGGTEDSPKMSSIGVHHDEFEQPTGDGLGIRRQTSVPLIRGKTATITVEMQKKGTQVIGE